MEENHNNFDDENEGKNNNEGQENQDNNENPNDDERFYNSDYGRLNHPDDIAKYSKMRSFKDFLEDKTNPMIYCVLSMDGKDFLDTYFEMYLEQVTNGHDKFTITVPDDSLDSFSGYLMENSKNLLGKRVTINFHQYGKITQTFVGIICSIRNRKENGYGDLFITGYSPTILLESGKNCRSFEDKTLEQIVKEITSEHSHETKMLIEHPNADYVLPYTVQYKESDYQFIQRMAIRSGEYFYYNGQQLILGNTVQPMIKLEENINLDHVEFELNIKPQHFGHSMYDVQMGEVIAYDSDSVQRQFKENAFQAVAIKASKGVYAKPSSMFYNHAGISDNSSKELKESIRMERENRENLLIVRGRSREPLLRIGGRAKLIDINENPMETYRIIEIKHYHDGNEYYNEFVGIPDLYNAPYQDSDAVPLGEEQSARVINNNDPMGFGRVRVQFPWQEAKGEKTPWIRVIQPHSGSGKGFHFIPEIGEEVIVAFECQNAEKPFVMGMHYNGLEKSGYHTPKNDLKVIKTRSGHTIIMDDSDGKQSITILDVSGNTIYMDTVAKDISITAPNNINIAAGADINITAGKNMNTNVGMNSSETVGMNKSVGVGMMSMINIGTDFITNVMGKMVEYITGNKESEVKKGSTIINNEKGIKVNSNGTITKQAQQEVKINSGERSNNH